MFAVRAALILLASVGPLAAHSLIKWPDPSVEVPKLVRSYIVRECIAYKGTSEETVDECIQGEAYGYRAVVEMLTKPDTGEEAAERYRACAAGLGDFGGRFHRRKAECIGTAFDYVWRFEFTRRASLSQGMSSHHATLPVEQGLDTIRLR